MATAALANRTQSLSEDHLLMAAKAAVTRSKEHTEEEIAKLRSQLEQKIHDHEVSQFRQEKALVDRFQNQEERLEEWRKSYETECRGTVAKYLDGEVVKQVEEKVASLQSSFGAGLVAHMEKKLDEKILEVQDRHAEKLLREVRKELGEQIKFIEDRYEKAHQEMGNFYKDFCKDHEVMMNKHFASVLEQVKAFTSSLPKPEVTVNVPEKSIHVQTETPQLILPEKSIQVSIDQKLMMPKRRQTTTKSILYDPNSGRPDKVTETMEEDTVEDSK